MSLIHARTSRPARAAVFLQEALILFNNLPNEDKYQDDGLLGQALIAMKREAEARALLLRSHAFFSRTYGEQNPQAILARRLLERLDEGKRGH